MKAQNKFLKNTRQEQISSTRDNEYNISKMLEIQQRSREENELIRRPAYISYKIFTYILFQHDAALIVEAEPVLWVWGVETDGKWELSSVYENFTSHCSLGPSMCMVNEQGNVETSVFIKHIIRFL